MSSLNCYTGEGMKFILYRHRVATTLAGLLPWTQSAAACHKQKFFSGELYVLGAEQIKREGVRLVASQHAEWRAHHGNSVLVVPIGCPGLCAGTCSRLHLAGGPCKLYWASASAGGAAR